jgi:prepilin-type processing-associated H-X9-DG protein
MREITLQPVSVMTDGGGREGNMVLADGHLVAVLSRVTAEETLGEQGQIEGWFLEAGFGPCGVLMSVTPPVFSDMEQAVAWVRMRLEAGFAPS